MEPVDVPGTLEFGGAASQEMNIILQAIMGTSVSARSRVDGSFVLKGFLPGEYNVQVRRASNVEALAGVPLSERMGEPELLTQRLVFDGAPDFPAFG